MSFIGLTRWECDAIHAINPTAAFRAKGIDNITWFEGTNPISKTDIQTKAAELKAANDAAATQKATDKTNGNQKLLDLGLTQAEVDALTGQ